MRIGYEDADTLITYPRAHNLSACAQPIRVGRARHAGALVGVGAHTFGRRGAYSRSGPVPRGIIRGALCMQAVHARECVPAIARFSRSASTGGAP